MAVLQEENPSAVRTAAANRSVMLFIAGFLPCFPDLGNRLSQITRYVIRRFLPSTPLSLSLAFAELAAQRDNSIPHLENRLPQLLKRPPIFWIGFLLRLQFQTRRNCLIGP